MQARRYPPIGDYGFLSDGRNWVLVSVDGSVDWACWDRADGGTTFSRLLDWDRGGHLEVSVADRLRVRRWYLDDTNVLVTRWETADGAIEVTDAMMLDGDPADPSSVEIHDHLVRRIRCVEGTAEVAVELRPRFDYGLTSAHVRTRPDGTSAVVGAAHGLVVASDIPLDTPDRGSASGSVRMDDGDERWLSLEYVPAHELDDRRSCRDRAAERLEATERYWRGWAARCEYEGPYREQVLRSALVLRGLINTTTGAVVAAPTTSLPEQLGGHSNWDYRYTWVRDAAWHINALSGLGYHAEAEAFMSWVSRTTAGTTDDLQVMYASNGGRLLTEVDLEGLEGYRGSQPVRVGNGAASQFQLDLFGELVSAAWHYAREHGEFGEELAHLLAGILSAVDERWRDPDRGIWEVRGASQQWISSKIYAWVAVDRLLDLHDDGLIIEIDRERAVQLRDEIGEYLDRHGVWHDSGAFTAVAGQVSVDSATLLALLEGYCDRDDPRIEATLRAIDERLAHGELVRRYEYPQGHSGREGGFLWASFWMVDALLARGEVDEARRRFERLLERSNDLGLYSEEVDLETGELLGNFPQAISHVGLIDTARRFAILEDGDGDRGPRVV